MFFYLLSNLTLNEILSNPVEWKNEIKKKYENRLTNDKYLSCFLDEYLFNPIFNIPGKVFEDVQHFLRFPEHEDQGDDINKMLNDIKIILHQHYKQMNFFWSDYLNKKEMIEHIDKIFENNDKLLKILFQNIATNPTFSFDKEDSITNFFLDLSGKLQQSKKILFSDSSLNLSFPHSKSERKIIEKNFSLKK